MSQFDFVMAHMAPGEIIGTSDRWKARARTNYCSDFFNDAKCKEPSIQMHEIKHKIHCLYSSSKINHVRMAFLMAQENSLRDIRVRK